MAGRGRPKTGGRQLGAVNKATARIKAIAQEHGAAAIEQLVSLMSGSDSDQVRVSACRELLDRGFGKPLAQVAHTDADDNAIETKTVSMLELARRTAFLAVLGDRELKQEEQGTEH